MYVHYVLGIIDFVFLWSSSVACVVIKVNKLPFICLCLYPGVAINKWLSTFASIDK